MSYCERCSRWFKSVKAREQHRDDSNMHHICYSCNKDFTSASSLIQHYTQSRRHNYCGTCEEHFDDLDELHEHYDDAHYWCRICDEFFDDSDELHEHRAEEHDDVYCASCQRMFNNHINLRTHERSTLHGGRSIQCPMKRCTRKFVSRAALVAHLESGGCASGMTRRMINELVARLDRGGILTDPARLIEYNSPSCVTGVWATQRAWNGTAYECYLCTRTFRSLDALNQHLRSPAHEDKRYRCPKVWHGCGEEFKTLSGFVQHMESEQCGVHRFKKRVDKAIDALGAGKLIKA